MRDTQGIRVVELRGIVVSGAGEAAGFTGLPWVKRQFADKLGIDAYPGTFNIMVLPADRERLSTIRQAPGVAITPPDSNFCAAKAFSVLVGDRIRGAVIFPAVPDYPRLQLEIVSADNVRQTLQLKDGDPVEVKVYLTEPSRTRNHLKL